MKQKTKNELSIFRHVPNILTISRIILTFIVIYFIFTRKYIVTTIIIFTIAALTDFLDGQLARRFKWQSEFGRQADIIADRFLWIGTAIAFFAAYSIFGQLDWKHGLQLLFIMTREIIAFPFAIIAFFAGRPIPHARNIAKWTTLLQGFALPSLILSIKYPVFAFLSWPLCLVIPVTGFISAMHYMNDIKVPNKKTENKK
ncbi:MAG: CDP-alcohol phosphatidyltransferase family protein [Nanoarchaeota archaeon]